MFLLLKYTLLYASVLALVALGGMFSERSGVINIALEGIMVIGGLMGVVMINIMNAAGAPVWLGIILAILVSALAGRENVLNAYKTAVEEKYRFFSFGDAMFIR